MTEKDTYVVVYQFGKVASTSLVAMFDAIRNVESVQSHFLGRAALTKILPIMLDPKTSDYFYQHQLGQFQRNVAITRRMNALKADPAAGRLIVLSLSRDPMEWFRSSTNQDIEAYAPMLAALGKWAGTNGDAETEVAAGMTAYLGLAARILDDCGGVETAIARNKLGTFSPMNHDYVPAIDGFHRFFLMMLRPFSWFTDDYEAALGIRLAQFAAKPGFWHLKQAAADYVILRYEDIDSTLAPAMAAAGLAVEPLSRKNRSDRKAHAAALKEAFAAPAADPLRRHFGRAAYSHYFGYADGAD